ncbi:MAG: polyphosphate kinase 2 family protein [Rhodothermales bacterium]|nr:polyphosphate kinase 2 family protein [Rhodothermales bacterium]
MHDQLIDRVLDLTKYRVPSDGTFVLEEQSTDEHDPSISKAEARDILRANRKTLAGLQERLYAESRRSVLLVLQAMDTGGKDSTIREVLKGVNPQGCRIYGFKAPSKNELSRDYLWRVHHQVPPKGHIGIFNRSHYEDVLIVRVHGWASPSVIEERYQQINDFERMLSQTGTRIIKVMLNISKEYQLSRLRRRLERTDKLWKFNPGDLKERAHWNEYMHAFEIALNKCSTDFAPWYVVPAETRWYRNLIVSSLLIRVLEDMNPQYPEPDFDPAQYPPESLT